MTAETTEPMASSATAAVLEELQLYGYRAFADEPDPRPLPEADALQGLLGPLLTTVLLAPLLMPALAGLPGLRPFTGERR